MMLWFRGKIYRQQHLICASVVVFALFMLVVGGCGGPGNTIGFGRTPPDEFAVVRKPPLTLPPDYSLRPPEPGALGLQEEPISVQAQKEVFGTVNDPKIDSNSAGEYALLREADALNVNPDMKKLIDEEFTIYAQESESFFEELLFWQDKNELEDEIINPSLESQRLRENSALGLPPNSGNMPVVKRREKAIFEGIF